NKKHSGDLFELPVITAAAMVVRTKLLKEIALFDPIFESYYEDIDYCRRIREAGWKLGVCPAATVYHFVGSATTNHEAELRRHRWVLRNRVIHEARLRQNRLGFVMKYFCLDAPRRILRSVLRTPSSQPLSAVIQSQADLMRLLPRIVSASKDETAWRQALSDMNWPWKCV
ncbi:glycosyltransferase, partial [Akkermansiaceae bacterium]|nr:glycosyltransferase [Akkermansiaceae bacterium]